MRKILFFMLLAIISLFFLGKGIIVDAANSEEVNYTANFTSGLPSDWSQYSKSDKTKTTVSNNNGSLSVAHSGSVTAANYHGALYQINPTELNDIGDFTLEMKFKVNSYEDTGRWIGIMYHTRLDDSNNLNGYMMNYRISGKSAQSTITQSSSGAIFTDSQAIENAGSALNDNKTHTIKIVCEGTSVSHYMDNKLIITYDYKDYSTGLIQIHTNGGFALIVNRMNIDISSLTITGKKVEAQELDTFINVTYDPKDNFVGEVGVVVKVDSKAELESLTKSNDTKPTTAILYVDENMNVCDENGTSLDCTLRDAYLGYLYQRIIPAVYVKTEDIAKKFVDYFYQNLNILDIFVVSDEPEIVKYVREEINFIRGIIDYSNATITNEEWKDVVATSNASYANVVILNPSDATYEAIRYIQARFKTVWINNDEMTRINVKEQIVNGAYGIIYDDYEFVYSVLTSYSADNYIMNRVPYNIAHRGLCFTVAENSLEGFIASYENGATHIEIDIRLTSDNQIVVMHDDTIDRTTNGTGAVASMTLAQIQKYKIDTYYSETAIPNSSDYTNIPSLDEVFNEFKDKDIVLVVEIKSYEEELVKQLKTLVNKYDMADNMVVITFANNQLVNMKNILPEIPTASLTSVEESVFTNTLVSMATSNCGYDGHYGTSTESYVRKLALRGYSSWFWTYQRESNIWVGMYTGTLGITNNEANEIADYAVRIEFKDDVLISSRNNYTKMQGTIAKYDSRFNETKLVSIAEKEEYDGYAHIIYKYTYSNSGRYYVVFSDKMLVLTKSLSEDINQLPEILNKDVKALTEDEVAILERLDAIAVDLEEKGVTTVDSEAIHKKLLEYQDSLTEDDDDQNQNDNQNPGDNQDPDDNITDDNNNDNVNPDEGEQDTENNKNEENDGEKEKPNLTPTTMSIGCSGSVMTSFFGLLTLAAAVIFFKKKSK